MLATARGDRLEDVFERLGGPPVEASEDELSRLGLVLVLDESGRRVTAAHYLRPVARDVHGHVQRLPPAVVAARDPASGRLEHFAWGIVPELADRIGVRPVELEREQARRAEILASERQGGRARPRLTPRARGATLAVPVHEPPIPELAVVRSTTDPASPPPDRPATLGELRDTGWRPRTVKEELRANLVARLASGSPIFPGIVGYDDSVIPAIENALLAGQDIVFLGERGQAKTRLARLLVGLLDEWLPVVRGGELNDDPFAPVSAAAREIVAQTGDETPDRLAAEATGATRRSWPRPTSRSPT